MKKLPLYSTRTVLSLTPHRRHRQSHIANRTSRVASRRRRRRRRHLLTQSLTPRRQKNATNKQKTTRLSFARDRANCPRSLARSFGLSTASPDLNTSKPKLPLTHRRIPPPTDTKRYDTERKATQRTTTHAGTTPTDNIRRSKKERTPSPSPAPRPSSPYLFVLTQPLSHSLSHSLSHALTLVEPSPAPPPKWKDRQGPLRRSVARRHSSLPVSQIRRPPLKLLSYK
mmetsp:Transcript_3602/g.11838  ORF Transcript_3602/g.11838 Transcript_3602/m.11838 type:complete len:227 (+) Transcript_3602:1291-1971(+)